jgi:hypothetical protein
MVDETPLCVGTLLLNSCQLNCKKLTNWTISAARRANTQNPAGAGFCGGAVLVRQVRQVLLVLPAGAMVLLASRG